MGKTAGDMIAEAKQEYVTKGQLIAAVDAASLGEAMQNMANPAKLKEMSDTRKIVMLRKGLPVVVVKKFNNGIVNIRPQGFDVTLWTMGAGLEEKK
ncbi:MAG: hypothetical protein HQL30_06225 [Candidatus Omnitrophica bacterium]|nr:hypothetical protein [Candidatus Omnitrophota bacterium]